MRIKRSRSRIGEGERRPQNAHDMEEEQGLLYSRGATGRRQGLEKRVGDQQHEKCMRVLWGNPLVCTAT